MDCNILHIVLLLFLTQSEAEFCFRKVHGPDKSEPGAMACRGLINRQVFPSSHTCCESKEGKGYARVLKTVGKRGYKWRCTPCWTSTPSKVEGWSQWSEWTDCSVTCEVGTKSRERTCQSGNETLCDGQKQMYERCVEMSNCPVDGRWGPWMEWSECSKSCSNGTIQRIRRCNNPPPQHGGKNCSGANLERMECNTQSCPVNGGWSEWTANDCDVTCGRGQQTKVRFCNNPPAAHGGSPCVGRNISKERCHTNVKCPVDGEWSLWSRFSSCSETCGEGVRNRTRLCVAPQPRNGGKNCTGDDVEIQPCYSHTPCPVDGQWTDWGEWSLCLARPCSNETGAQLRTRTCSNPQPKFRGKACSGTTTETQRCYNSYNCPVDGSWCEWQAYSECRKSTKNIHFRIRLRECECPKPLHGGSTCQGDDYSINGCYRHATDSPRSRRCNERVQDLMQGSGYIEDDEDC